MHFSNGDRKAKLSLYSESAYGIRSVDCISFGNNSVSVSMYILVIPVRIKTMAGYSDCSARICFCNAKESTVFNFLSHRCLAGNQVLRERAQTNHSRYSHQSGFNNGVKNSFVLVKSFNIRRLHTGNQKPACNRIFLPV